MAAAGRVSGLAIQALRHLGKNNVDDDTIDRLKTRLSNDDKQQLLQDISCAPAWIGVIFRKMVE